MVEKMALLYSEVNQNRRENEQENIQKQFPEFLSEARTAEASPHYVSSLVSISLHVS